MKLNKYYLLGFAALSMVACSDLDNQFPEGEVMSEEQSQEANVAIPSRSSATYASMFTLMGQPLSVFHSSRPDDYGFVMMAMSNDLEGADAWLPNSGYNWFSVCGEYTSRNADYANPYVRYMTPYNEIRICNEVIAGTDLENANQLAKYQEAQAHAVRAFSYLQAMPSFQFLSNKEGLCVPIVPEYTIDYANNPRATVAEVFKQILDDLDYAIENLEGYQRESKAYVDQQVAYGLRARANLAAGNWKEAAEDAEKALKGYTPYTLEEVSTPAFCDLNDHNWLWGVDMTPEIAAEFPYATSCSWIGSFSGDSYSAACACYVSINNLLYNKIPDTDIRKQWWIDADLQSQLLEGLTWGNAQGQAISQLAISDVKEPYYQYTNVKFGLISGVGSDKNDSDWPLLRAEELILIKAEGQLKSGNESAARATLTDFVKTYRDPKYSPTGRGLSLADEIWFQRRVELWGEGFSIYDSNRLGKPIVRFHEGEASAFPDAFQFNLAANDGYRLMRFPQTELDTNFGIKDNKEGTVPLPGDGGSLRDGVTD